MNEKMGLKNEMKNDITLMQLGVQICLPSNLNQYSGIARRKVKSKGVMRVVHACSNRLETKKKPNYFSKARQRVCSLH